MRARLVLEKINFERGIDPKDSMRLGDVEGRKKKRDEESYKIRVEEIKNAAKTLSQKHSKPGHILRSQDALRYYTLAFKTKKNNDFTLSVTYYAPRYELTFVSNKGKEERLAFERVETLIKQVEFFEKHSNKL